MPSLMYAPGKILSVRLNKQVDLIDVNGALPVVTPAPNTDQVRYYANTTVMADGRVLLNGGSAVSNKDSGSALKALTWDPANPGLWSVADSAQKIRLYHSVALLMPDGTVLTGAGGAPGPVRNLNAEIYYPSYLHRRLAGGTSDRRGSVEYHSRWPYQRDGQRGHFAGNAGADRLGHPLAERRTAVLQPYLFPGGRTGARW
jgi:hypothetical protein